MAALRFAPLFALPVLGGVLLAFVIATFERDPASVDETVTATDDQLATEEPATVVQPTAEPEEEEPAVADESPPEVSDPLANLNLDESFEIDDFSAYWRENLPPSLADIIENGFGGPRNQP